MDHSKERPAWQFRGLGLLGILGSMACSGAMTAALLGLAGASAAGAGAMGNMPGMSEPDASVGPLAMTIDFLIWAGPVILVLSLATLVFASWLQRPAVVPIVLAAGAILFWGMYVQSEPAIMLGSIAAGLAALFAAHLWSAAARQPRRAGR